MAVLCSFLLDDIAGIFFLEKIISLWLKKPEGGPRSGGGNPNFHFRLP